MIDQLGNSILCINQQQQLVPQLLHGNPLIDRKVCIVWEWESPVKDEKRGTKHNLCRKNWNTKLFMRWGHQY